MNGTVIWDGEKYAAVDVGAEGGRYAVARKGFGIILLTNGFRKGIDEQEVAISTAKALDASEKKGFFSRLFG